MAIDLTELEALDADLQATAEVVHREGRAVVSKGALNIKEGWRANATASARAHGRKYPYSISYDLLSEGIVIEAEIGPERHRPRVQGFLAEILEFGSVHNPPHNDGGRALTEEEPRFVTAVEEMAQQAIL